jgi:hypothetical protein
LLVMSAQGNSSRPPPRAHQGNYGFSMCDQAILNRAEVHEVCIVVRNPSDVEHCPSGLRSAIKMDVPFWRLMVWRRWNASIDLRMTGRTASLWKRSSCLQDLGRATAKLPKLLHRRVTTHLSTSQRNRRELPQLMHKLVPAIGRDHKLFVLPIDLVSIVAEDVG